MKTKVAGDARLTMVARWPLWPWGVSLDNAGMLSIQQKFQFEVSEIPCALNGMAHSGCTDPTQATTRLVIVLVGKIQKSGTGDNSFAKCKGTCWSDRQNWPDRSAWTTFKGVPKYSGRTEPKWSVPFERFPKFLAERKEPQVWTLPLPPLWGFWPQMLPQTVVLLT